MFGDGDRIFISMWQNDVTAQWKCNKSLRMSRHTERNRRFDANGCDAHLKRYCLCGGNDKEHFQFDFMTYIYILVTILHLQWSRPCLRRRLWVQRWQRGQRRAWASGVWARRTWAKSHRRSSSLRSTLKVHRAAAARHVLCVCSGAPALNIKMSLRLCSAESEFRYARWKKAVQKSMNWETTEPVGNGNGRKDRICINIVLLILATSLSFWIVVLLQVKLASSAAPRWASTSWAACWC